MTLAPYSRCVAAWLVCLAAPGALAQVPLLTRTPAANAVAAPRAAPITLTFGQSLDAATAANLLVTRSMAGRSPGAVTVAGPVLTFTPTTGFHPGEDVTVTVPATIQSTGGAVVAPQVYQFTAAAAAATAQLAPRATTPSIVLPGSPGDLATVDIDADGDLDLLVCNYDNGTGSSVSVYRNDGTGRFTTLPTVSVGAGPFFLTTPDIDSDGDPDLLVSNVGTGTGATVSVRLNDGAGTFTAPAGAAATVRISPGVLNLVSGDLDADGDADLIVVTAGFGAVFTLNVRLNDGNGNFTAPAANAVLPSGVAYDIALADADTDGDLDLLATNIGINGLLLYHNDGTANFGGTIDSLRFPGQNAGGLRLGDLDLDGDLDAVIIHDGSSRISVALNQQGHFVAGPSSTGGSAPNPQGVTFGDLDGDGDLDLLIPNNGAGAGAGTIVVRLNNGSGRFSAPTTHAAVGVGAMPSQIAVADLDNDGTLDFAATNFNDGTVSVRFNTPTPLALSPDLPLSPSLTVWPNPAHQTLQVQGAAPNACLTLTNTLGQVVLTTPAAASQLDVASLPAGVYLLNAGTFRQRIVLE